MIHSCRVISLRRRPERLRAFYDQVNRMPDWPLPYPQVFDACDGALLPMPSNFTAGPGAFGCLLSNRQCVQEAIQSGADSVMIFEDDAVFKHGFVEGYHEFIKKLPSDWEGFHLGTEHIKPPEPIAPGIVRSINPNRTHAYCVRGRFMRDFFTASQMWNNHVDWLITAMAKNYRLYAPDPLLVGQRGGKSDINGQDVAGNRVWDLNGSSGKIITLLKCNREQLEDMRVKGFHVGHNPHSTGVDNGLLYALGKSTAEGRVWALKEFFSRLNWEASQIENGQPAIWYPPATDRDLEEIKAGAAKAGLELVARQADELDIEITAPRFFLCTTLRNGGVELLPHWLDHYFRIGVDQIVLCVLEGAMSSYKNDIAVAVAGLPVKIVYLKEWKEGDGENNQWEMRNALNGAGCRENDWVLHADLDEFHEFSRPLDELVRHMAHCGLASLRGFFVDRVSANGHLPAVAQSLSIWDQFPIECSLIKSLMGGWDEKVMLARHCVQIQGGHHAPEHRTAAYGEINGESNRVHHFKWTSGVVDRIEWTLANVHHETWAAESRRFLEFIGAQKRIDVSDPRLASKKAAHIAIHIRNDKAVEKLNKIKNSLTYHLLDTSVRSNEGHLFFGDPVQAAQRLAAVEAVLNRVRPARVIETGTHKCFFGWFCHGINPLNFYKTFGNDPESRKAADILDRDMPTTFIIGDTKETFTVEQVMGFDLAWIDGGHDFETASHDLITAMAANVPVIMVDDLDFNGPLRAFESAGHATGWKSTKIHPCVGLLERCGQ